MNVIIRGMEERDIKDIQQVAKKSWYETYKRSIPLDIQEHFLNTAYQPATLKRRLQESRIFVAKVEKHIVGFIHISNVKKDGRSELGALYLLPHYQRRGIGTALLDYSINRLKGLKEIYLHVEKNNKTALKFYEAKGFEKVSKLTDYLFGHKVQTIQMCLKIK